MVLACNTLPSINDITAGELAPLLPLVAQFDSLVSTALQSGRLRVVASGNDIGVIDLREVSAEVAAEAGDADLVVLEGMGRGIETNLRARFAVDVMCLGMIKHPEVAERMSARMYDVVCRFSRKQDQLAQ